MARTTPYATVQIKARVRNRLKTAAKNNGWPIGYVVERLVTRFLDGHFSGSLADVLREDASPELRT